MHIHPFIYFTNDIKVASKRKDHRLNRADTLSQPSIAIIDHETILVQINGLKTVSTFVDNEISVHKINFILKFTLQSEMKMLNELLTIDYLGVSIDKIKLSIDDCDYRRLTKLFGSDSDFMDEIDESNNNEIEISNYDIIREVLNDFFSYFRTKV